MAGKLAETRKAEDEVLAYTKTYMLVVSLVFLKKAPMQTIHLGNANISIINLGDLVFKLKEVENVPESEWRPKHSELFETPLEEFIYLNFGSERSSH